MQLKYNRQPSLGNSLLKIIINNKILTKVFSIELPKLGFLLYLSCIL